MNMFWLIAGAVVMVVTIVSGAALFDMIGGVKK